MEALRAKAKSLHKKISQISEEISGKENEITKLRESNAALIESSLGKQRKPKSLEIQRNNIVKLDIEILELKLVKKSLNAKLAQADADIRREKVKNDLAGIKTLSQQQLSKIRHMQDLLLTIDKTLCEIEACTGSNNSLYQLLQLLWNSQESKSLIDVESFLKDWSSSKVNMTLPDKLELRLAQFNTSVFGLWNQMQALASGSRTVPSFKLPKPINRPLLDKHQLRILQAGQEAKEVREKKHNTMRFVHQAPAAPPG